MTKKSDRRDVRVAAAQARDFALFERGTQDAATVAQLRSLEPRRRAEVVANALRCAESHSAPDRREALVVLGAHDALRVQQSEAVVG